MRIGILTFHCAHNYGAVLQSYALQEYLKSLGNDVEIIDYRPKYLKYPYRLFKRSRFSFRKPLLLIKQICDEIMYYIPRWLVFESFIHKYFQLSKRIIGTSLPINYDIFVFGSDQIWNPDITIGGDPIYFASFRNKNITAKYFAYAASIGIETITKGQAREIANKLKNFDKISVRENADKNILSEYISNVEQVLDPTLLVEESFWLKFAKRIKYPYKYVLIYQVRHDTALSMIAQNIAEQLKAKVIIISAWGNSEETGITCLRAKSPNAFISLIQNASCIITSSFHGLSFSIVFKKPFYVVNLGDGSDGRAKSLLETIGLQDRMIKKDTLPLFSNPDYTRSNIILPKLRADSKAFISSWFK